MRFFLDNDTPVAVCGFLSGRGHDCWWAYQAGRADDSDDGQAIYAAEKGAILVTHDRDLGRRQIRNTFCATVVLCCPQPDAVELFESHIDIVEAYMDPGRFSVLELFRDTYRLSGPRWE